jgi:hypothetical protein
VWSAVLKRKGECVGCLPSGCGRCVGSSFVLWAPCSGVGAVQWRAFEPTTRVWRSGTTSKQPANLGFEAAEESLSILPGYTPTVRPPPKRC